MIPHPVSGGLCASPGCGAPLRVTQLYRRFRGDPGRKGRSQMEPVGVVSACPIHGTGCGWGKA